MELSLGYITAYDPSRGTVDIRTQYGTTLVAIPFDSSLSVYATPVLPIIRTENGRQVLKKSGSLVVYATLNDANVRIIRMFGDDQAIVETDTDGSFRIVKGTINDTLLYALQDGELLLSAPGRIFPGPGNTFERMAGAWALFKNSGELLLSNALSSCQIYFDDDGDLDIRTTQLNLVTPAARIWTEPGAISVGAGPTTGATASLRVTQDGVATLTGTNSVLTLQQDAVDITTQDIKLAAGGDATIQADYAHILATTTDINTTTWTLDTEVLDTVCTTGAIAAAETLTLSAGTTLTLAQGTNTLALDEEAGAALESEKTVTIKVGDSVITVSENGIDISSTKPVTFNNGTLYAVGATAPGPIPAGPVVAGSLFAAPLVKLPQN